MQKPKSSPKPTAYVQAEVFRLYTPPEPMDIVLWCERFRRLSSEGSSEPGPYRMSRAPFFAEPMRACVDPRTREVVCMGASQISKTESLILNVLAYKIANDPAPSLLVTSTLPACQSLSHDRFEPMCRDCAPLRGLVAERGGPNTEGGSTIYRKSFKGGHLTLVGSNSASGLARMPIRDLYLTEVDRFSTDAGNEEGDPVSLARIRTSTFHDAKVIMESSPTVAGRSRIEAAYLNSTQEHWYNACPSCGFFQIIALGRMDFATATHRCEHCGEAAGQSAWQASPGEWRAHGEHPTIRGFHIPCWPSPLISWQTVIEEFRVASRLADEGDSSWLRVIVNTRFAECFVEAEARMNEDDLLGRREEYEAEIPDGVLILLASVDSQDDRLCYQVSGIGRGREAWLIEYGTIWGDLATNAAPMYQELEERVLARLWRFGDGQLIKVRRCAQDAMGHHSSTVYTEVKKRARQMIAFRGRPVGIAKSLYTLTHSSNEGAPVLVGTVDLAKDLLSGLLKVPAAGRGYLHIPAEEARGFGEAWAAEMMAERKEIKYRNGQRIAVWTKRAGSRNEAWDLMVMTLILAESLQLNMEQRTPDYYSEENKTPTGQRRWGVQNAPSGFGQPQDLIVRSRVVPRNLDEPDLVLPGAPVKPRYGVQNKPMNW